jgi:hypothetical protein
MKLPIQHFGKWQRYDIVRKDRGNYAIWLESASDLDAAASRIDELNSVWPGEFQVIDQHSHQVVAKLNGPDPGSRKSPSDH